MTKFCLLVLLFVCSVSFINFCDCKTYGSSRGSGYRSSSSGFRSSSGGPRSSSKSNGFRTNSSPYRPSSNYGGHKATSSFGWTRPAATVKPSTIGWRPPVANPISYNSNKNKPVTNTPLGWHITKAPTVKNTPTISNHGYKSNQGKQNNPISSSPSNLGWNPIMIGNTGHFPAQQPEKPSAPTISHQPTFPPYIANFQAKNSPIWITAKPHIVSPTSSIKMNASMGNFGGRQFERPSTPVFSNNAINSGHLNTTSVKTFPSHNSVPFGSGTAVGNVTNRKFERPSAPVHSNNPTISPRFSDTPTTSSIPLMPGHLNTTSHMKTFPTHTLTPFGSGPMSNITNRQFEKPSAPVLVNQPTVSSSVNSVPYLANYPTNSPHSGKAQRNSYSHQTYPHQPPNQPYYPQNQSPNVYNYNYHTQNNYPHNPYSYPGGYNSQPNIINNFHTTNYHSDDYYRREYFVIFSTQLLLRID